MYLSTLSIIIYLPISDGIEEKDIIISIYILERHAYIM